MIAVLLLLLLPLVAAGQQRPEPENSYNSVSGERLEAAFDSLSSKYSDFFVYADAMGDLLDRLHMGETTPEEYLESLYAVAKHQAAERRNKVAPTPPPGFILESPPKPSPGFVLETAGPKEVAGLPPPPMPVVDFTPKPPQPRGPGYTDRQFSGHEYEPTDTRISPETARAIREALYPERSAPVDLFRIEQSLRGIDDSLNNMQWDSFIRDLYGGSIYYPSGR